MTPQKEKAIELDKMKTEEKYLKGMCEYIDYLQRELIYGKAEELHENFSKAVFRHKNFLQQKTNLGMFVTAIEVNGVWEVLEEPLNYKEWCKKSLKVAYDLDLSKYEQYQQALNNVIFDGFEYDDGVLILNGNCFFYYDGYILTNFYSEIILHTIEDLVKYKLKLK